MTAPQPYLFLSVLLFSLGIVVIIARRHPLIVLLGIELVLQAANLSLGALAVSFQDWDGRITTSVTLTVASAELFIGIGILWAYRRRQLKRPPSALKG